MWHPGGRVGPRRLPATNFEFPRRGPRRRHLEEQARPTHTLPPSSGVAAMDPVLVQGLRDMKSLLDDGILTQVAARAKTVSV